jgi:hypothetical protein
MASKVNPAMTATFKPHPDDAGVKKGHGHSGDHFAPGSAGHPDGCNDYEEIKDGTKLQAPVGDKKDFTGVAEDGRPVHFPPNYNPYPNDTPT